MKRVYLLELLARNVLFELNDHNLRRFLRGESPQSAKEFVQSLRGKRVLFVMGGKRTTINIRKRDCTKILFIMRNNYYRMLNFMKDQVLNERTIKDSDFPPPKKLVDKSH